MKRALIGGFISLIGSIWALGIIFMGFDNLVSEWPTPPGRLLTTVSELGMMPWFAVSVVFVLLGVVLMVVEYFHKENS